MMASELGPRIDHVMMPVADLARSVAFYDEAFGMKVVERREDETRRFAHVGYGPRGAHVTIELVQEAGVMALVGGGHVCIRIPGLGDWVERMEAAGHPFARPHGLRDGHIIRCWIQDPDGHLVEVSDAGS
jgi:lactoylglutathione lyase